ncbi:hypothetical protein LTR95_009846 [Oleoguttula sp. CCFEE 5521]
MALSIPTPSKRKRNRNTVVKSITRYRERRSPCRGIWTSLTRLIKSIHRGTPGKMDCAVGQHRVYSGELRFIDGDYICDDCAHDVAKLFERALEHEIEYPPRVPAPQFPPRLHNQASGVRYQCRAKDVLPGTSSPNEEVCNNFLGALSETTGDQYRCSSCTSASCAYCKAVLADPSAPHTCGTEEDTSITDHLAENTRGLEYQLCPNPACHAPTFLREGCNHMICPYCKTHFCHLCGLAAPEHSGHWLPGGCPRYGRPDVARPQFNYPTDEHGSVIDEDTDEDTEDDAAEDDGPLIPDEPTLVLPELLDADGVMPIREAIRQLGVRERGRALQHLPYYLHTDFITRNNAPWLAERFNHVNLTIASQDLSWTQPMLELVHSFAASHSVGFRNGHPPRSLGEILYSLRVLILQAQALQFAGHGEHDVEFIDERFAEMHDSLTDPDIDVLAEDGMQDLDRAVVAVTRRGGYLEGVWWAVRLRATREM